MVPPAPPPPVQRLGELTGTAPRFFRPTWGMVNASLFGVLRRAQTAYVLARSHAGAIVDLHDADGVPGTPGCLAAALPAMIDGLRDRGYTLTTVGEPLG